MSFPEDVTVHYEVIEDNAHDESTLARALVRAMEAPLVGEPRRPRRVRVAAAPDILEIREVAGTGIFLSQAPTPEVDYILEQMQDSRACGRRVSWLDEVPDLDMTGFFEAAARLFSVTPWEIVDETCLIRVDAPELGLEGAVVSIAGATAEEFGFLLFPSMEAHDAYLQGAKQGRSAVDFGTSWLTLSYDSASIITPKLLADVRTRGLPLANPDGYPSLDPHGADGKLVPLRADHVRTITAVASALARLFEEFDTRIFGDAEVEDDLGEAVNVTYPGGSEHTSVELTAPYWPYDDEDREDHGDDHDPRTRRQDST